MNIAYVAQIEVKREDGVLKKIIAQIRAWQSLGHDVRLHIACRRSEVWAGLSDLPLTMHFYDGFADSVRQFSAITREVTHWSPDAVYLRFSKYYPGLEHLTRRIPTVMEINSDDITEGALIGNPAHFLYHRLTRHRLLQHAVGLVYVTREISQRPYFTCFGKPALVMGNSIDLSIYPELPAPANARPRLVFMGSAEFPWFGFDKLAFLARNNPEWHFDLIGMTADAADGLPNVTGHGLLGREAYELILARADVAVGALALHRKHMNENSPLKTREYFAYGIPMLVAHDDIDFPTPTWFICRIPNVEENVRTHLNDIRRFVMDSIGKRVSRREIAHLDTGYKEQERVRFIQSCLHSSH